MSIEGRSYAIHHSSLGGSGGEAAWRRRRRRSGRHADAARNDLPATLNFYHHLPLPCIHIHKFIIIIK